MNKLLLFEYNCPECRLGTVRTTKIQNYKTKIKGYPFIVDEVYIGVCDHCKAEHFASTETKRWKELFYRSLEQRQAFLPPQETTELRKTLGLSMEDFARLIGCTRQSIYNWEKVDRSSPPSRMADLLMKLVRQSLSSGSIDVLAFILQEAKKWGVVLEVRQTATSPDVNASIVLRPKLVSRTVLKQLCEELSLAAKTESEEEELLVETPDGKPVGILEYKYELAALVLNFTGEFAPWKLIDAEIETQDGRHLTNQELLIQEHQLVLIEKTTVREKDVARIILKPHKSEARE
jgi:DNA-binding transcriptional regulator YiaG